MAEIRRRRTVIAAKVEATVGTSETLTAPNVWCSSMTRNSMRRFRCSTGN
jgi:hypothetical protein